MPEPNDLQLTETDDGQWAVVRDGETLSTHPNEAGAEAERTRIAEAEQHAQGEDPPEYTAEEGPNPGNVAS